MQQFHSTSSCFPKELSCKKEEFWGLKIGKKVPHGLTGALATRMPKAMMDKTPYQEEKVLLQGNLCYHAVNEMIRLQEHKLWGIFPKERGTKNHFWTTMAKTVA